MSRTRKPHRKYQIPENPDGVRITDDDEQILLDVFRHDIIDSAGIFSRFPNRSEKVLRERLRKLSHNGYLHRLDEMEQLHKEGGGSYPVPYTLGAEGAEVLKKHGIRPQRQKRGYIQRVNRMELGNVFHNLENARFLVGLRGHCEADGQFEFLYPDEIYRQGAGHILEREKLPTKVVASVTAWNGHSLKEGTKQDGFFQLINKQKPEGKQRRNFFLEIDRGMETIEPGERARMSLSLWKGTSLLRKFIIYHCAQVTGVHKVEYGIPVFQVLTVTTNPDRALKMAQTVRKHLAGRPHHTKPHWFLFTDQKTISQHDCLLDVPLINAEGKPLTLRTA